MQERSKIFVLIFVCLFAWGLQVYLLCGTEIPLGVPGEWTWPRIELSPTIVFNLVPVAIIGAIYVAYVSWVAKRIERNQSSLLYSAGLVLISFFWIFGSVGAGTDVHGLGRTPFILFYERSSGYFTQARDDAQNTQEFLKTYQTRISDSDLPENYLHQGTHPPGLTIGYRMLINACERSTLLVSISEATQPESVRESFTTIRQNSLSSGIDFPKSQQAALWWAILMTGFCTALTTWPLFLMLQSSVSRQAAWWAASIWPLVPAVAIFLPKSDVLFPFLAVLMQWLWLKSLDRNKWWLGGLTGGVVFCAMCLSLAFAPVGVILGLQFIFRFRQQRQFAAVLGFIGAIIVGIAVCWFCFELNIVGVWIQNLHNHAAFYKHHSRSYLPWLLVNPVELAGSVGAPLAVWGLFGLLLSIKDRTQQHQDLWIAAGVWSLLWISGKNMGEAGRLWILLMPIVVWAAAISLDKLSVTLSQKRCWGILLILLQMLICLITVLRVDGFHLDQI